MGVFFIADNGKTWDQFANRAGDQFAVITSLAAIDTTLFAGTTRGLFRSTGLLAGWTAVDSSLKSVASFAVTGDTVIGGGYAVFLSTDNGKSWVKVDSGLPMVLQYGTAFLKENTMFGNLIGFITLLFLLTMELCAAITDADWVAAGLTIDYEFFNLEYPIIERDYRRNLLPAISPLQRPG